MITLSHSDTLSEFLQIWMDVHVGPRLAPKTAERWFFDCSRQPRDRRYGARECECVPARATVCRAPPAAFSTQRPARSRVHSLCLCGRGALGQHVVNKPGRPLPLAAGGPARSTCYRFAETGDLIAATAASWVGPAVQLAAATGARRTPRAPLVGLRCTSRRREDPGSDQLCRFGTNPEVNQEPAIANRTPA
jgi:hypothetical protein